MPGTESSGDLAWKIEPTVKGRRLDHYLQERFPHLSRAQLQRRIKEGLVRIDGGVVKAGERLKGGEEVLMREPPPVSQAWMAEELPLEILWEDEHLLAVNKAPGMVVHPAAGHVGGTLVNALLAYSPKLSTRAGSDRPGIVHRLDKETSGVLVVAKDDSTHRALARQFAERQVQKLYLAWVQGIPARDQGEVELFMGRHPVHRKKMAAVDRGGRTSKTGWRVLHRGKDRALVLCRLHTGRTHQIRLHMKSTGHPLVNDKLYGGRKEDAWPRFMLHAWKLGFQHPAAEKEIRLTAPLPTDFPFPEADLDLESCL